MPPEPKVGYQVIATVIESKGYCHAGHQVGDRFEIGCHNTGNLCGFFYHDIFPDLQTFQFGGRLPWWDENTIEVSCPDSANLVTLRLDRFPRDEKNSHG